MAFSWLSLSLSLFLREAFNIKQVVSSKTDGRNPIHSPKRFFLRCNYRVGVEKKIIYIH